MSLFRTFTCFVVLLVATSSSIYAADYALPQMALATVIVNSTADTMAPGDGFCTLREAITNTNNGGDASGGDCAAGTAAGADQIIFNIAGGGSRATISLTSSLPTITSPLSINGNTQCATPPCIKLDGSSVADPGNPLLNALTLNTGSSVIRGLVFANWPFAGLQLEGAAGGNLVQGNHFGVDFDGITAAPLLGAGIEIISSGNTIGGITAAARNIISGNSGNGITIFNTPSSNASENTVAGNYIGTDITGTIAVGNTLSGIVISESSDNTIGGLVAGSGNLISGNKVMGVWIYDTNIDGKESTGNLVQGNLIGTDITGTKALGNFYDGVRIGDASSNTIGGTSAAARNIISGNGHVEGFSNGVSIFRSVYWNLPTDNNLVQGNYIGTDISGTQNLGNKFNGVLIGNAKNNTIGGTETGAGNLIAGQEISGVYVYSPNFPTTGNTIQGNFIGINAAGTAAIGHSIAGVYIDKGANSNLVGGTATGAGNAISGNVHGVTIWESNDNTVQGNLIGTNAAGTGAVGNTSNGVYIDKGASNNLIGGTTVAARNLISGNTNGVNITDSTNNQIIGNDIRNQADIGIVVRGTSAGNELSQNRIFNNTNLGIDLGMDGPTANDNLDPDTGPNNLQNFPTLATATAGSPVITGNLNSLANTQFTIEYFSSSACDSSGFGEGQFYLGAKQVTTNGSGNASVDATFGISVAGGYFITATATAPDGSTSEFSACVATPAGGAVIFEDGFES